MNSTIPIPLFSSTPPPDDFVENAFEEEEFADPDDPSKFI